MATPTTFPPHLVTVTIDCADPGRLADERKEEDGWVWWIVADPEGDEACLVQSTPDDG